MYSIVTIPNAVLTTQAKTVTVFDKKLRRIVSDMKQTLLSASKPKGVGLAAPQVGIPYRIFITRPTEKSDIRVFINPEILHISEKTADMSEKEKQKLEGCLSIPNIWGHVTRAQSLTLRYQDEDGTTHEEEFSGFLATIIQHETDHTNGVLFSMRVIEQRGTFYQVKKEQNGKEVLEEIELR